MKKTPKGREVYFRARVDAALPTRPMVFAADDGLPQGMLLDQPTAESKSARNLARYFDRNGGPFEMMIRAYIQNGANAIRLFAPWREGGAPLPWRDDEHDGGYQGSIPRESPRGLAVERLFDETG